MEDLEKSKARKQRDIQRQLVHNSLSKMRPEELRETPELSNMLGLPAAQMAAQGLGEAIGSEAGYLVPPTFSGKIFSRVYAPNSLLSQTDQYQITGKLIAMAIVTDELRADAGPALDQYLERAFGDACLAEERLAQFERLGSGPDFTAGELTQLETVESAGSIRLVGATDEILNFFGVPASLVNALPTESVQSKQCTCPASDMLKDGWACACGART